MRIFIPENTPSSKNSKVMTKRGIFHSKAVRKYLQKLGVKNYSVSKKTVECYKKRPNLFEKAVVPMRQYLKDKTPPHLIKFYFIRNSKRKFDGINAMAIICDLLVAHNVIFDDDMDNLIPSFNFINDKWYDTDKENAGVLLDF